LARGTKAYCFYGHTFYANCQTRTTITRIILSTPAKDSDADGDEVRKEDLNLGTETESWELRAGS